MPLPLGWTVFQFDGFNGKIGIQSAQQEKSFPLLLSTVILIVVFFVVITQFQKSDAKAANSFLQTYYTVQNLGEASISPETEEDILLLQQPLAPYATGDLLDNMAANCWLSAPAAAAGAVGCTLNANEVEFELTQNTGPFLEYRYTGEATAAYTDGAAQKILLAGSLFVNIGKQPPMISGFTPDEASWEALTAKLEL